MNKTILENRKFQAFAAAVCLLLFGCQGERKTVENKTSTTSYSTGYVQNDTNAIDANETNDDSTTDDNDSQNTGNNDLASKIEKVVSLNLQLPLNTMKSCKASGLDLIWPLHGSQSTDWTISQYYDLDFSVVLLDYAGSTGDDAKTYSNHKGTDIAIPSFKQMDAGQNVYAAASGKVIAIKSNGFDRSYGSLVNGCDYNTNYVVIEHDNGFTTHYEHLRKNSVVVSVGQQVSKNQKIGQVGSSGCSTHPHLHFEVKNCNGDSIDPFENEMWENNDAPLYQPVTTFMDVFVKADAFSYSQIVDPPANITTIKKNKTLGVAFAVSAAQKNDQLKVRLIRPNGTVHHTWTKKYTKQMTLSLWTFSKQLSGSTGTWALQFSVNNTLKRSYLINVTN